MKCSDISQGIKKMITLKQYGLLTLSHLIPIELLMGYLDHNYSAIIPITMNNINFMYFCIVGIHALLWMSRKYGDDLYEIIQYFKLHKTKLTTLINCVKVKDIAPKRD